MLMSVKNYMKLHVSAFTEMSCEEAVSFFAQCGVKVPTEIVEQAYAEVINA